ncbi:DUF1266 domain-containing protein [Enterovibrio nigricans]|uniref:DUF1266 domain-containing protein n=1 Tax=Enterovibrio nigricans DSM 22720 TaxID=1121868 RepID=A0A1T4UTV4_9GAMM|nr:DUF1266 domain-containing protein [Enterovibrio nigricans]SKA56035.1 Protein of unknown function [Enterovibrio nigricans DSM 22720]
MPSSHRYALDPRQPHCQWWLAIAAPQISYNRQDFDYLLPELRRQVEDVSDWEKSFVEWWGISTRREWHEMIHRLAMGEVHGDIWRNEFGRRACMTGKEWEERIHAVHSEVAKAEMRYLDATYRHSGKFGFLAWDYSRAGFFVRAGFCLGKVTQEECAFLLNFLSKQIRHRFAGWSEYLHSFIFGRNYWDYIHDEDDDLVNVPYLLNDGFHVSFSRFFEDIENDKDCPIHWLDWGVPLPELDAPESLIAILNEEPEVK